MKRQVTEGVNARILSPVAIDIAQAYEAASAMVSEIDSSGRYAPAYRQKLLDDIAADTAATVERAKTDHRKSSTRDLDAAEGQLHSAIANATSDPAALARGMRAQALASQASQALSGDEIGRVWDNALVTADDEAIRAAGIAGRKRMDELVAAAKSPAQRDAAQARAAAFDDKVQRWSAANPTPAERLTRIERQRAAVEAQIEESALFVARLYNAGDRTRVTANLAEGPAFGRAARERIAAARDVSDVLGGNNPSHARR